MRNFLFVFALSLLTLPTFAYGPMIVNDGLTASPAPEQGNNYGPMIIVDGIFYLEDGTAAIIFVDPEDGAVMVPYSRI